MVEEWDVCGVGFIVYLLGKKSYEIILKVLFVLICLEYCGGCSVDKDLGDGVGLMI